MVNHSRVAKILVNHKNFYHECFSCKVTDVQYNNSYHVGNTTSNAAFIVYNTQYTFYYTVY